MNLSKTMSMGDYAIDCDLAELDHDEARQESAQEYVHKRSRELFNARMSNVTVQDFVLALEMISTYPSVIKDIFERTYTDDVHLAASIRGAVEGALMTNSIEMAVTEAMAMASEPPSRERH